MNIKKIGFSLFTAFSGLIIVAFISYLLNLNLGPATLFGSFVIVFILLLTDNKKNKHNKLVNINKN